MIEAATDEEVERLLPPQRHPGYSTIDADISFGDAEANRSEPATTADGILPPTSSHRMPWEMFAWMYGPPPEYPPLRLRPWLPTLQRLPGQWLDATIRRVAKTRWKQEQQGKWRMALAVMLTGVWAAFYVPLLLSGRRAVHGGVDSEPGFGDVVNLDCTNTFWYRKNGCGVDGIDCQPFSNVSFDFRCPAQCASVRLFNPRPVGPLDVSFRSLVIGSQNTEPGSDLLSRDGSGANAYRGDSWVCAAAIHAGVISNSGGGCGHIELVGQRAGYSSIPGGGGVTSLPFDSYFPLSFRLSSFAGSSTCPGESRGLLLFLAMLFTIVLSVFATSPLFFFCVTLTVGIVHVGFVSDPPPASFHSISVLPDQTSLLAGRALPAGFCLAVIYCTSVKRTLAATFSSSDNGNDLAPSSSSSSSSSPPASSFSSFSSAFSTSSFFSSSSAPLERTLFWLGGFWFGALNNYTLNWIPIQRLTAYDLNQQPGAKLSLAIIVGLLALIAVHQAYDFWLDRRFVRYLSLYALFIGAIVLALLLPASAHLNLRLHHYIVALLLLPGTSLTTRPSLLYQGLLVGLFVNGVIRWGFASVLETDDALRDDAPFGQLLPSVRLVSTVVSTVVSTAAATAAAALAASSPMSTITLSWDSPPASAGMQGISVLVNDVERMRHFPVGVDNGAEAEVEASTNVGNTFTWTRPTSLDLPEYFRFAFIRDGAALDYTKAGTWAANGSWFMPD